MEGAGGGRRFPGPFPSRADSRRGGRGEGGGLGARPARGQGGEAGPEERVRPPGRGGRRPALPLVPGGAAKRQREGGHGAPPPPPPPSVPLTSPAAAMEKQPGGEDDCVDSGAETGG